ncbi:MAG: histidine phosphatase family protein [Lachnospiraceae bacterium]|nr:histidine phosphatase family protein [Lachnospiraceae bacterium]
MKIYLIRHGRTKGNIEKRYVGATDEGLADGEEKSLEQLKVRLSAELFDIDEIYVSPLKRCVQTGAVLFPKARQLLVEDFRECDFGAFEYKNHDELLDNPVYQRWLNTGGEITFPGGESKESFQKRVVESFLELMRKLDKESILLHEEGSEKALVLVVHGGTIMSILDKFGVPHRAYFHWQVGNGQGYVGDLELSEDKVIIGGLRRL